MTDWHRILLHAIARQADALGEEICRRAAERVCREVVECHSVAEKASSWPATAFSGGGRPN